ncbi:EamA family transporter [Actinomadura luteofluorescens]|uniref:EamA family transporter n=1 Tax=Actinomadura luteofluorescens TaxID=46163 RepID=UPI003627F00E
MRIFPSDSSPGALLRVTEHLLSRASGKLSRSPARRGGADVLLAATLWGTTGTVRTFADGASPYSVAAIRIIIGGLVLLALAASTRGGAGLRRLVTDRRNLPLVGLGAAAITVYQTAFFVAAAAPASPSAPSSRSAARPCSPA